MLGLLSNHSHNLLDLVLNEHKSLADFIPVSFAHYRFPQDSHPLIEALFLPLEVLVEQSLFQLLLYLLLLPANHRNQILNELLVQLSLL